MMHKGKFVLSPSFDERGRHNVNVIADLCRGAACASQRQGLLIMAIFVGIDGIRNGWVAVYLNDDGNHRFARAERAAELLSVPYERAMIDMPIGLPERGYRSCDIEARGLVGPRVFLGARYGIWTFETLDDANAHYWEAEGAGCGISMQLFCIRTKLQEMNETGVPPRVFEAHPELFFWRVAGRLLDSKKTKMGRDQRVEILENNGIAMISDWLEKRRGTGIGRDDLIDACACALVARDSQNTVPVSNADARQESQPKIWY
jgi:predicted RNase H-like nuclease